MISWLYQWFMAQSLYVQVPLLLLLLIPAGFLIRWSNQQ